jgi:tRNA pseudouridine32 synthase/23S rRNA pseudouridine746 synthase
VDPQPPLLPLAPPPDPGELPALLPSPFDALGPHPLARRAAEALQAELRAGQVAPGVPASLLEGPEGGKMFGVLVVRAPGGGVGVLRAFSGMLAGRWEVPGYCPPLFAPAARAAVEGPGEAQVKALLAREEALRGAPALSGLRAEAASQQARHAEAREALRGRHEARKRERHARREGLGAAPEGPERAAALHALDQESRGDKAERRRLEAAQEAERAALAPRLARLERRVRAHERLRRWYCRTLMQRLHDTYRVRSARGEARALRALYAPAEPPSGAADCAAPKLLAEAARRGLVPLALAEFWWGAPPATGGRVRGAFYGACRDKCGPLLPFLLEGLQVAPARAFAPPVGGDRPLEVLYEDAWLVVVDKPAGLLSVPARDGGAADSVLARLRARHPRASGPLLVHRLDLDTSGLLVAALEAGAHRALQRQFLRREVHKRYVAVLAGEVAGEGGRVELPLRVDLADRPRQIVDPAHGRPAVTDWRVLAREGGRTRVALFPLTGRTHQLRVHAAHPRGLGAAILGDRLYGHAGGRLHLHAEALAFTHPGTGRPVTFERPAPF